MKNKFWYRIFVLSFFVTLLSVGSIIGYKLSVGNLGTNDYTLNRNEKNNVMDDTNILDKEAINIYNDDEVESVSTKTYDIEVIYIDYYTLCDEEIASSDFCYGVKVEEVKEQEINKQKREENIYEILEESNERIVFKKVIDTYCPNHFKVILEESKINVYSRITEKEYRIYKTLDIPVETLRLEVVNELTGGILVESKEELNMIIEDIES